VTAYRLDVPALHAAVDAKRTADGLSWRQLADLQGMSASTLSRTAGGLAPDAHALVGLLMWLAVPVADVALPVCSTCRGKPRRGFTCNDCGAGAQR
jgi:transcriptional regulator with XRE-family HTH domain